MTPESHQRPATEEPRRYTRGRLSRGQGLRKTTGCATCRKRHVKCDEVKPRCGGCTRKNARCEYTEPQSGNRLTRQRSGTDDTTQVTEQIEGQGNDRQSSPVATETVSSPTTQQQGQELETTQARSEVLPQELDTLPGGHPDRPIHDDSFQPDNEIRLGDGDETGIRLTAGVVESPQTSLGTQGHDGTGDFHSLHSIVYGLPSPSQMLLQPGLIPYANTPDSGNAYGVSLTNRWLDLLIGDATLNYGPLPEVHFEPDGTNIFGNSVAQSPVPADGDSGSQTGDDRPRGLGAHTEGERVETHNAYLRERIVCARDRLREKDQAWKALEPLNLQPHEHVLFRHFTDHVSRWVTRHLDVINRNANGFRPGPNDTIGYYYKTLHYCQEAMQYDTYQTSLELLASAIIISSYEMLDGSSTDWEKHLKGVFWIQRSQTIHGHSGGLRQAVWWAWLCQDVWAAFREKRKPLTFWQPTRPLTDLDPSGLAAHAIYNFAHVVGFCAQDKASEKSNYSNYLAIKTHEAELLSQQLEQWKSYLTFEFNHLPMIVSNDEDNPFPTMWIQPPAFAVSMQIYYCSMILLHLHRPCSGGYEEYLDKQRRLKRWASMVCGVAKSSNDQASSTLSSQCIFIGDYSVILSGLSNH
ncbi:hypothetical protein TPAR_04660, partial [Tolypocladium paradoxum]